MSDRSHVGYAPTGLVATAVSTAAASRRAMRRGARRALGALRRSFRRGTAIVLALAFFGFGAETLVADVHDGDAPASEVARFGGEHAHEGPEHPTSLATRAVASDAQHDQSHAPAAPGAPGGHGFHACHCVHAHAGAPPPAPPAASDAPASFTLAAESDREPSSAALEPGLRPPIA